MRSSASCSIGASASVAVERALQEAHAVVEQVEAGEAVADDVQVGPEAGDSLGGSCGVCSGRVDRKRSATHTRRSGSSWASR